MFSEGRNLVSQQSMSPTPQHCHQSFLLPTSVTNKNLKFNLSVNDWIKMNPEGVSYQYEFERFTTDERTQNIRLSSSLNDFRSARIPGKLLLNTLTVALTF